MEKIQSSPSKRVLVVDDEKDVADITVAVLEAIGHSAFPAYDAAAALNMLELDPAFDLLLTDIRMPDMNGVELARRAQGMYPALKVLYYSGYSDPPEKGTPFEGALPRLNKPFNIPTLAAKIDAIFRKN